MQQSANQNLFLIEGAATYERILADVRDLEMDEGLRHLKDFLKIYPDFAKAHNDVAVLYYQTGNSLKALAHYEKAHKLDPGNVTYRKNLADFYFVELEWTGDAIHTYLDILKDNPFDIESLNALGSISLQIGRKEQARQYFSRTLQLDTGNPEAQEAMRLLSPNSSALPDKALNTAQLTHPLRVPEQCPQPAPPAPAFRDLFREAVPAAPCEPAIAAPQQFKAPQLQPAQSAASPEELYREALQHANKGNNDEAIILLEKLLQQNSGHAAAHNDLGVLFQKKGDRVNSRHHHEEAVRLQPANKVFQKNLADLLYVEFYELEEALAIYVRLQAKAPQDIEILKGIASICRTLGNQADARFFIDRILTLQPWDRDAQAMLKAMEEAGV